MIIEKLVTQGRAVKQPSFGGGKSFYGYELYLQFLAQYEQDANYTKYEIMIAC